MKERDLRRAYKSAMSEARKNKTDLPTYLAEEIRQFQRSVSDQVNAGHINMGQGMQVIDNHKKLCDAIMEYGQEYGLVPKGTLTDRVVEASVELGLDIKYEALGIIQKLKKRFGQKGEIAQMIEHLDPATLKKEMYEQCNYVCSDEIAKIIYIALVLGKPILIEGPPGCGKTEIAKVLATVLGTSLVRLQCYEGIDEQKALYEWNYQKQILTMATPGINPQEINIFGEEFLLPRPLLTALQAEQTPVLLIDEVDKTDEEFEAYLLEILSDFQVSIPELGTVVARRIPPVVLTSNAVRDLGDALRRRCVYLWIGYPTPDKEAQILMRKNQKTLLPGTALQIAKAMQKTRSLPLLKQPSISESLDLAQALAELHEANLTPALLDQLSTLFLKNKEDLDKFGAKGGGKWVLDRA